MSAVLGPSWEPDAALRRAFAHSPDPVILTDRELRIAHLNPAAAARWPTATPGAPAAPLFPAAMREAFTAAARTALAAGAARFEWGEHAHGEVRGWFTCAVSAVADPAMPAGAAGAAGASVGLLVVSTETTEYKQVEQRLRWSEQLMVDTQGVAHLGTWEWDVSQTTVIWSAELYRIYGLTPETYTPSYEQYLTMVHPDDRQRVMDATARVFQEHIPYSHDERVFRPDGSLRYLHTWAHPVLDATGTLIRLVGVCQDITDQKRAEEALHQLNLELEGRVAARTRQLETSLRDLEAFNSMVSHDLRAPLGIVQMGADLIARQAAQLPARSLDHLDRIRRAVAQMSSLIDDLLGLARVSQQPIERAEVDVSALSTELLAELQRADPDRRVEVVIDPDLRCPADLGLLRAALTNLLGNAWKYSARCARPRIEVRAHAATDSGTDSGEGLGEGLGAGLGFLIKDNGVGFDMSQAHRLFTPFERLHDPQAFAGTGVGLATVHRIIERHGGRIWAESAPEAGATFYVELPR